MVEDFELQRVWDYIYELEERIYKLEAEAERNRLAHTRMDPNAQSSLTNVTDLIVKQILSDKTDV